VDEIVGKPDPGTIFPVRFDSHPLAVTNPIWVDLDGDTNGDGDPFEPPGPPPNGREASGKTASSQLHPFQDLSPTLELEAAEAITRLLDLLYKARVHGAQPNRADEPAAP
jgi:hypothetical protein